MKFTRKHRESLASRPVWLFSSGPLGTDLVDKDGKDALQSSRPKEFARQPQRRRGHPPHVPQGCRPRSRPHPRDPGDHPEVLRFADEVVDRGYTVVMPHLFGDPGAPATTTQIIKAIAKVCVSNEFIKLKAGVTSPVADWLRSLARSLHRELGGPGVGAIGMCLTGGFALAMMVDESIAAPVLAQPSLPGPLGRSRAGDLGLSPADREAVRRRVAGGCPVLGVRYRSDPATGTRFDTLTNELGDGFIKVELDGKGHATLTADRHQIAVDRVLDFFDDRLKAS